MARPALSRARETARGALAAVRQRRESILLPESADTSTHWQRIVMNRAFDAYLEALGPRRLRAAEISGRARQGKPWASHTGLDYPAFDLCAPLHDAHAARYDVVICEQVLEHVIDPCRAAANLRGLCVPGGRVAVSTPFLVRVHELPAYGMHDYWRFTPRGLRLLLEHAGLQVDHVGSWGNRECIAGNFERWPAYRRWHSLRDEPDLPLQVWAFATRPGGLDSPV